MVQDIEQQGCIHGVAGKSGSLSQKIAHPRLDISDVGFATFLLDNPADDE